jgi:hypothetical protein
VIGRIQIQAENITHSADKLGIVAELEILDPMGLAGVRFPDPAAR